LKIFSLLFNWTVTFPGRGRAQRAITTQQVFARQALETQATVISPPGFSQPASKLTAL